MRIPGWTRHAQQRYRQRVSKRATLPRMKKALTEAKLVPLEYNACFRGRSIPKDQCFQVYYHPELKVLFYLVSNTVVTVVHPVKGQRVLLERILNKDAA